MSPLLNWAFILLLLYSVLSQPNILLRVAALPLEKGCNRTLSTSLLEKICPSISKGSEVKDKSSQSQDCTIVNSQGVKPSKCDESQVIRIGFNQKELVPSTLWGINLSKWTKCDNYLMVSDRFLQNILDKNDVCVENSKFLHIAFQSSIKENAETHPNSSCVFTLQQYTFSSKNNCSNWHQLKELLNRPYCTQQIRKCLPYPLKIEKEPLPLQSYSKQEVRKVDRPEVNGNNRRQTVKVRKHVPFSWSWSWSWRDHVLELTIFSIFSAIILVIGLKICLAERFTDTYQNNNFLTPVSNSKRRVSYFLSSTPHNSLTSSTTKGVCKPSKPILKNGQNYSQKKMQLSRILGNSFESNSSIYYDAMEFPEAISQNQNQPLISNF